MDMMGTALTNALYDLPDDLPSALILVDMQRDWFSGSEEVRSAFPQLPANVEELLAVFRERNTPVVHVRAKYDCPVRSSHMGFFKLLNPEKPSVVALDAEPCALELPGEMIVFKPTFDGFHNTNLHAELQRLGVRRVYVAGLVTAACVLNTCFGAFRHGYETILVTDCTADRSRAQHDAIIAIYSGYTFIAASLAEIDSFLRAPVGAAGAGAAEARRTLAPSERAIVRTSAGGTDAPLADAARAQGGRDGSRHVERRAERAAIGDAAGVNPEARSRSASIPPSSPRIGATLSRSDLRSTSSLSLASASSSSSGSSTASSVDQPHASTAAPAVARGALVGGVIWLGLSGISSVAWLCSVGVEAIAAGHGDDERPRKGRVPRRALPGGKGARWQRESPLAPPAVAQTGPIGRWLWGWSERFASRSTTLQRAPSPPSLLFLSPLSPLRNVSL